MNILSRLDLTRRACVMGILNVTPDSFSDGGRFFDSKKAVRHSLAMVNDGADIIDVGGESTRPGSRGISAGEELRRVIPVIKALAQRSRVPISIDTMKSEVADEAIRAGATIVNDVSGLKYDNKMASVAAKHDVSLIIMHMRGTPRNMQLSPRYRDTVRDIISDLRLAISKAVKAGVDSRKIVIDPGIGFGKTLRHNLEILNRLEEFKELKAPICIGTSRKSFIGRVLGVEDPGERIIGTVATCVIALMKGARLIRVHEVKEALQAVRMTESVLKSGV
ncbi:MAG: dihydropteroate synthase [Candidatus Omnitrophica bacterium]|nr:dihydropteroate synthase [Candidatus Omnitrophota bacterium]MBU1808889.1 dihydropteroate synthase [Candidatus Omnitrophota bacterium]